MATYDVVTYWASLVQQIVETRQCGYVVDILRSSDLTTPKGIKDLSDCGVAHLQNNLVPGVQDAVNLWQVTQCLKKFRFGCTATPEEMQFGWLDRNARLEGLSLPWWIRDGMRELLAPLGPAFEATEGQGRFGNGAVYERNATVHARWNRVLDFPYNVRFPDDIRAWDESSCLSARLSCVPKDMLKLRTITVEPAEATFLQQFYRSRLIEAASRVLPYSTAIPQQVYGGGPEVQRRRALAGSLTGKLATIDLSDASDSISIYDVTDVFPCNVVAALERARSPYVEYKQCPNSGTTRVRCHMYAGMGNATTFIVESLYFWALFTTICRRLRCFTTVSVFGDDIVVPIEAARHPLFSEYVASAHVTLNMAKCGLSDGPGFREACGLAAYNGCELPLLRINGYRLDNPVELVSLCSLVNTALDPDSRYAPFVREIGEWIGKELAETLKCPILPERLVTDGVYLADPSETIGGWSYRSRWNPQTAHPEVKVKVLETGVISRRYKSLTPGEMLGLLHGQLRTTFSDAPIGFKSKTHEFCYPTKEVELKHRWVPCWSSDASLTELGSGD